MIVVDSSSIISMAVNCLCPLLDIMDVEFAATPAVYNEIVGRPSKSKKFAFESLRIRRLFDDGVIKTYPVDSGEVNKFIHEANRIYSVKNKPIKIMHAGESEAMILGREKNADAFLMDERTSRLLMEDPYALQDLLSLRNKKPVDLNEQRLENLKQLTPDLPVIRSSEILAVAYEKGVLSRFMSVEDKTVFTTALNALKLSGCAITWEEIEEYDKIVI